MRNQKLLIYRLQNRSNLKKTEDDVDNLTVAERERLQVIMKVQEMLAAGFTYNETANETGLSVRTVARYRSGDPEKMCLHSRPGRINILDSLREQIYSLLAEGYHPSGVYYQLKEQGHDVHKSTVTRYVRKLAKEEGIDICKHHKGPTKAAKINAAPAPSTIRIKRTDIQKYIWMNEELKMQDMVEMYEKYPIIMQLKKCVSEFREIFNKRNMPMLYLFIENYKKCPIPAIKSFASGLEKDIDAVENAVASELSNGFVEGVNSKIKMVKRTMYGRCGKQLLAAKLMYQPNSEYG